jgi:GT2 family glycosyltransferase
MIRRSSTANHLQEDELGVNARKTEALPSLGTLSSPGASSPRVLIIILTHNHIDLTVACLNSLRGLEWPNFETLVVDNASTDATLATIRTAYPEVRLIANKTNVGYVEGNNLGLRYALASRFDYALLLNNDTEVAPDFLRQLVEACEANSRLGVVGPLIYYHTAPNRVWSAGGIVDRATGTTRMRGVGEEDTGQFRGRAFVDFVTGCALLVRISLLPKTGLLDERFGMYFEETEWCARIRRAGWEIAVIPESLVWHKIEMDGRALSCHVNYYMTRNRLLYLRLTHAPLRAWLHATFVQDWRTWISWGVRPKWRDRAKVRKTIPLAWRDFLTGRFGMASYWD